MELLHIGGEVIRPRDFDFAALRALGDQLVERSALLAGREIAAVPVRALLALAGLQPSARALVAESADGRFRTTLPLDDAAACVLVYRVGEAALPPALGGPFRLVTRGRLRAGDVKSVGALYVSDRPSLDSSDSERLCYRVRRAA